MSLKLKLFILLAAFCCLPLAANAQCEAEGICNHAQVSASIRQVLKTAEKRGGDEAFINGATAYYNLMNAYTAMTLTAIARKTAQADLTLAEEQFASGETNSFAVTTARSGLLAVEASLLKATRAWVAASADLSLFFEKKPEQLYIPADVDYDGMPGYTPPDLQPDVDLTVFEDIRKRAQKRHRRVPDYQLEHALVLAHSDWHFNGALKDKALAGVNLARTNLHQTQVSFEAGLSSRHDVLNAELFFQKAQSEYLKAAAAYDLSRLRLLQATGTLEEAVEDWLEQTAHKI